MAHARTNAKPTRLSCRNRAERLRAAQRSPTQQGHRLYRGRYHIVEHDGGWTDQVGGALSETFPSHEAARRAAQRAAAEQHMPGETSAISWEDSNGKLHEDALRGAHPI